MRVKPCYRTSACAVEVVPLLANRTLSFYSVCVFCYFVGKYLNCLIFEGKGIPKKMFAQPMI